MVWWTVRCAARPTGAECRSSRTSGVALVRCGAVRHSPNTSTRSVATYAWMCPRLLSLCRAVLSAAHNFATASLPQLSTAAEGGSHRAARIDHSKSLSELHAARPAQYNTAAVEWTSDPLTASSCCLGSGRRTPHATRDSDAVRSIAFSSVHRHSAALLSPSLPASRHHEELHQPDWLTTAPSPSFSPDNTTPSHQPLRPSPLHGCRVR